MLTPAPSPTSICEQATLLILSSDAGVVLGIAALSGLAPILINHDHYPYPDTTLTLSYQYCRHTRESYLNIENMAVNPLEKRKGTGRRLVCQMQVLAFEKSMETILVTSSPDAKEFYLKLGFVPKPRCSDVLVLRGTDA